MESSSNLEMQGQSSNEEWSCPSFSSYSSDNRQNIADVASRVISQETQQQQLHDCDGHLQREISSIDDDDDDFQFVLLPPKAEDEFAITGSKEFGDYQVGYLYPVFNRNLLLSDGFGNGNEDEEDSINSIRLPFKKLFTDHDDQDHSSSSADELEEIPPETYCVWKPKSQSPPKTTDSASPGRCKKSNSTGSSSSSSKQKLWRLRDLLRRSRSDGKESLVFLQNPNNNHGDDLEKKVKKDAKPKEKLTSAHEVLYVRNKALKEKEKKRTYLPYRQDLFGGVSLFPHASGLGGNAYAPF